MVGKPARDFAAMGLVFRGTKSSNAGALIDDQIANFTRDLATSGAMARQPMFSAVHFGAVSPRLSLEAGRVLAELKRPLLVSVAYFLGAEAAFQIGTLSDQIFALFWPPNVILFYALLTAEQKRWWIYVAAAFPAHLAAEFGVGMPALPLLVAFLTNSVVALLNAYLIQRFVGDPPWLGSFRKALRYILIAAGIGPGVAAFGGAFVPILGGGAPTEYWTFWLNWYAANAIPNLTLGSALLIWVSRGVEDLDLRSARLQAELCTLVAALVAVCVAEFTLAEEIGTSTFLPAVLVLPLPLILWASYRFGERGASGSLLIAAVTLTALTLNNPVEPARSVLALQVFLMELSIPVLLLAALIDELRRTERSVRNLSASLLHAEDGERRRIARELHDSTGQTLIAALMLTHRLEQSRSKRMQMVRQIQDMLQQSIRELRTVSYILHPPLLTEHGLSAALSDLVTGYVDRSGIAVSLEGGDSIGRLPRETELALFRIIQEALTNISRHSDSPTARVRLAREGSAESERVVVMIEDAGKGIAQSVAASASGGQLSPHDPKQGVGLASMRERLHQIGGELEIHSKAGHTILRAVAPARAIEARSSGLNRGRTERPKSD